MSFNLYIAAIVLVVVVVIYLLATWHVSTFEDYLYGFWAADGDEFCEESEIDSMLMFIGGDDSNWKGTHERNCYLIIMPDMCAQGLTITYRAGWAHIGLKKYRLTAEVKFDEEQIWPEQVNIDVDMRCGLLHIYSDKTNYAKLYKQHDISSLAAASEDAEMVTK